MQLWSPGWPACRAGWGAVLHRFCLCYRGLTGQGWIIPEKHQVQQMLKCLGITLLPSFVPSGFFHIQLYLFILCNMSLFSLHFSNLPLTSETKPSLAGGLCCYSELFPVSPEHLVCAPSWVTASGCEGGGRLMYERLEPEPDFSC